VKSCWWPKIGCGGKVDGKNVIATIQVNLCCPIPASLGISTNSPEFLLLKFLPSTYHHSRFLDASLDFTKFSILHWGHTIFIARLF